MSIRLGDTAPDFTAETTAGLISFHDWTQGSWAVLFSHPADFTPVDFPIIADSDRAVAQAYDMIHPGEGDTSTVRSVFLIDPNNKVRLTITYPKSVGRNFTEILRALDALQATDGAPISTPAEWVPGDRVIVAPTISTADAQERFANVDEVRPYLRFADAPA